MAVERPLARWRPTPCHHPCRRPPAGPGPVACDLRGRMPVGVIQQPSPRPARTLQVAGAAAVSGPRPSRRLDGRPPPRGAVALASAFWKSSSSLALCAPRRANWPPGVAVDETVLGDQRRHQPCRRDIERRFAAGLPSGTTATSTISPAAVRPATCVSSRALRPRWRCRATPSAMERSSVEVASHVERHALSRAASALR